MRSVKEKYTLELAINIGAENRNEAEQYAREYLEIIFKNRLAVEDIILESELVAYQHVETDRKKIV